MAKNGNKATATPVKKVASIWARYSNPIRTLNTMEIERMLQNARWGDDVRLQGAFYEIERNSPIFSICISKRQSGVLGRKWSIRPVVDSAEGKAQAERIQAMFDRCAARNRDGVDAALEHLAMYAFRGRSAVKPHVTEDGELLLKRLDNWNLLEHEGVKYWNPTAESPFGYRADGRFSEMLKVVPDSEIVYADTDRALDWAGISIYLRLLVGEEQWARAVEKFGIPQVLIKTPDGTPESDLQKWDYRAQAIFEGGSGTLPAGTAVDILTAARGQDPFSDYIAHQMQMFAILATGSTLETLGGTLGSSGAGMGSDIASKQGDQFDALVTKDCKVIANAMGAAVEKCARFLGYAETLCRFEFVEDEKIDVAAYLGYAKALKDMGIAVDVQKLKELTKLDIIADDTKDVWTPTSSGKEG